MEQVVNIIMAKKKETGTIAFQGPTMSEARPRPTRPMIPVKLRMMICVKVENMVMKRFMVKTGWQRTV